MNKVWAVVAVATLGLVGCMGHAEMVKRDKAGGVLALKGDRGKAMEDANAQMAANCPNGFEIVGEEMAKVGEVTEAHGDTDNKEKGKGSTTNASSVTSEVKEYRITYQCKVSSEPASS
jgi:hypothetical protein